MALAQIAADRATLEAVLVLEPALHAEEQARDLNLVVNSGAIVAQPEMVGEGIEGPQRVGFRGIGPDFAPRWTTLSISAVGMFSFFFVA